MKREEVIGFLKSQLIGDLEQQIEQALASSSDEQLSALYKSLIADDPKAREAAQALIAKAQPEAAPKIDMSKLRKPKPPSGGGSSGGGTGGEQVW